MLKKLLFLAILLSIAVASASADEYLVTMNTSGIDTTTGYVDFQFNPGSLTSQAATLQILNFTSNGTLAGSPTLTGDASGGLPGPVTLTNGTVFNDYFEGFTFGNNISFDVVLSGVALTNPVGSGGGSAFAFSIFGPDGATPLLTSDPNGYSAIISVDAEGMINADTPSTDTTLVPTSEPSSVFQLGIGLLGMILAARKRLFTSS